MSAVPRHVLKLGGSLLDCEDLIPRFRHWLTNQEQAERVLILGGGDLAESIRRADRLHHLGEETSHWLCIQTMSIHAQMVASLLPEARWCASARKLADESPKSGLVIVDPWIFVHDEEPNWSPTPLPATWDVTSDSIAARLAKLINATELTLLKSSLPTGELSWNDAANAGYVDSFFPYAVAGVPRVRAVNLRHHEPNGFPERTWRRSEVPH